MAELQIILNPVALSECDRTIVLSIEAQFCDQHKIIGRALDLFLVHELTDGEPFI